MVNRSFVKIFASDIQPDIKSNVLWLDTSSENKIKISNGVSYGNINSSDIPSIVKTYNSHTCNLSDLDDTTRYICESDYNSIWTDDGSNGNNNYVNLPVDNYYIGREVIVYNAGILDLRVYSKTGYGFTVNNNSFNPTVTITSHKIYKFTWGFHGGAGWQISEITEPTI